MSIPKVYAYGELPDGTTWEGVRVVLADRIALDRSARANGWNVEAQQQTVAAYLSWQAARRTGVTVPDWAEFLRTAVDAAVTEDEPADADDEADSEADPTRSAPSSETP